VFIVKLGGSVLSHKDGYREPNLPAIHAFARIVRSHWAELAGRLLLVIGGGSYGHGISLRYQLRDSSLPWRAADLPMTTLGMLEWRSIVAGVLREEGVPCFPFQTSSYLVCREGRPLHAALEPVKQALSMGLLPLLSGDLVFDTARKFVIFSSDAIPELFVRELPVRRVVMATNVPGVLKGEPGGGAVLARITRENRESALHAVRGSSPLDVSGGMRTKVEALLRLADAGVEGVICDGRTPEVLLPAMLDAVPPGTFVAPNPSEQGRESA